MLFGDVKITRSNISNDISNVYKTINVCNYLPLLCSYTMRECEIRLILADHKLVLQDTPRSQVITDPETMEISTLLLYTAAAPYYCSTLLLYTAALHCCSIPLLYNAALHCCSIRLLYTAALQHHCSTLLIYTAALYHCCSIRLLYTTAALYGCSTLLLYTAALHCYTTLLV